MGLVRHNEAEQRYELEVDGCTAIARYQRRGDILVFTHTEVPSEIGGRGIATRLVAGALEDVWRHGWKIRPACSFVASYVERHPETRELLAG